MWVAMELLTPGRLASANLPRAIDNYRPSSLSDAIERAFGPGTGEMNDNLPQRPQGSFRVRAMVTRGLQSPQAGQRCLGGWATTTRSALTRGCGCRPSGIATMTYEREATSLWVGTS